MDFDSFEKIQIDLYKKSIAFLVIITLVTSLILFLPFYYEHKEKKEQEIDLLINSKEKRIEQFFERLKITTELISNRTDVKELLSSYTKGGSEEYDINKIVSNHLVDTLQTGDMLQSVMVTDVRGNIIGVAGKAIPKEFFKEIYLSTKKTTHFTIYELEGKPVVLTVSPILKEGNEIMGFDIVMYKAELLHDIVTNYEGFGTKGESIIGHIDKEGKFKSLYSSRAGEMRKEIDIHFEPKIWQELLKENSEEHVEHDGKENLIKAREIANTKLILLVSIDKDELYNLADNHFSRLLLVAFLLIIFGIFALRYISTQSLEKIRAEIELRKRAQKELENYQNELEMRVESEVKQRRVQEQLLMEQSKMAAMGEMVGFITHQWKQPLTVLSMLVDSHQTNFENNQVDRESIDSYCDSVHHQLNYLTQTINDFRDFFKPAKQKSSFNLQKNLKDLERLISFKAKSMSVNIDISCSEEIALFGYPNEFKQAILNILNNGIDAINQARVESFKKPYEYPGYISVKCMKVEREEMVRLLISDNGNGIPDTVLPKIFEPHFTTKGEQGSGIGLYMSKLILEQTMQGHIGARNSDEGGAEFVLDIPINSRL